MIKVSLDKVKKVKDMTLDLTVPTGGADLRFLALQPGSAMGGRGPAILCFRFREGFFSAEVKFGS